MQAVWRAAQIQGHRNYQEDFFSVVENDTIFYRDQEYNLEPGLLPSSWSLYVLADGMGGMGHGDLAAATIVERFVESFLNQLPDGEPPNILLEKAAQNANLALAEIVAKQADKDGMGATLIALLWDNIQQGVHWLSIGDSLLGIHRQGELIQLNQQHTWGWLAEQKRNAGESLDEATIEGFSDALCSAVDGTEINYIDQSVTLLAIQRGDVIVIASDGVESLSSAERNQILTTSLSELADITVPDIASDRINSALTKFFQRLASTDKVNQDNTTVIITGFIDQPKQKPTDIDKH